MKTYRSRIRRSRGVLVPVLAVVLGACAPTTAERAVDDMLLGEPVAFGNGSARTYVQMRDGQPVEVGVALTERALEGLPAAHDDGGIHVAGHVMFERVLALPASNPTPYTHVLLNWNPGGHEPPGIYDLPHVDFHFYTIESDERLAIDERDPRFQHKAERKPAPDFVPAGYVMPAPLPFPRMGVHWVDPTSPELNGEPFTHTFIFGSWDGALIFAEPMVTTRFLASRQEVARPLPTARLHATPGHYPTGYRIGWDEGTREHRIALTGLTHTRPNELRSAQVRP